VTPIDSKKFLGGAGIVAAHCQALGAEVALLTCLGDDVEGGWAEKKISDYGVKLISVKDNSRPTTFKQRFRAGTQSLLRLSHLRQEPLSEKLSKELFVKFSKENFIPDVILFSDFSYGLCNDYLVREVINYGKLFGSYFSADSQSSSQIGNLSKFFEMNLISATEREVRNEVRDFSSGLIVVSEKLKNNLKCETLIVKIGPDGIILHPDVTLDASNSTETIEALNSNPTDVSGAGDSLLAAATLARGVKLSELESAFVGSVAASIQVSRLGNKPISKNAIIDVLSKLLEG
jgi:rfaE bifunctional protein kinase chain/domain